MMIERTSRKDQLAAIYTSADIFFNPTREDNYPTVNLEAQACGTPVMTYDVGGCRETIAPFSARGAFGHLRNAVIPDCDLEVACLSIKRIGRPELNLGKCYRG